MIQSICPAVAPFLLTTYGVLRVLLVGTTSSTTSYSYGVTRTASRLSTSLQSCCLPSSYFAHTSVRRAQLASSSLHLALASQHGRLSQRALHTYIAETFLLFVLARTSCHSSAHAPNWPCRKSNTTILHHPHIIDLVPLAPQCVHRHVQILILLDGLIRAP